MVHARRTHAVTVGVALEFDAALTVFLGNFLLL